MYRFYFIVPGRKGWWSVQSQVLCGDCYDILPKIPSGVVSLAFVDPPYNFGIDYGPGKSADRLPPEEYVYRMESLIRQCVRCLTKTGCLWFLCPERWADDIGSVLSGILPRRNRIIWRETFGQYRESSFPSGHRHLFYHVKELKLSPYIANAMIYGANKPYNVALIVPDVAALKKWSETENVDLSGDLAANPKVVALIQNQIESHSNSFKGYEKPQKVVLTTEDFTTDNGLLTPTMKLKRQKVWDKYGTKIEQLYS